MSIPIPISISDFDCVDVELTQKLSFPDSDIQILHDLLSACYGSSIVSSN